MAFERGDGLSKIKRFVDGFVFPFHEISWEGIGLVCGVLLLVSGLPLFTLTAIYFLAMLWR